MTLFANSILRYYEHIYGYENKTETACVVPKKEQNDDDDDNDITYSKKPYGWKGSNSNK